MATELQPLVQSKKFAAEEIASKTRAIYESLLNQSDHMDAGNFTVIHPHDLELMFNLYDGQFFDGGCRKLLADTPLEFRLSKRMTQAGGKAVRKQFRVRGQQELETEYELVVSSTLLFQTFQEDHRPVVMSGLECRDRLQALQRIVEHEMTHLIEMLIWEHSSCSAARFQSIANRFFGHTEHRHQLITPREAAFTKFGIQRGDRVEFRFEGRHYAGIVSRITKRATVLVEDAAGQPYSDGKRYSKFYVPVSMLKPTPAKASRVS